MDEKLVKLIKGLLPAGSEVLKIYKDSSGQIKVDVEMPGMGSATCSLKQNHAGALYLD